MLNQNGGFLLCNFILVILYRNYCNIHHCLSVIKELRRVRVVKYIGQHDVKRLYPSIRNMAMSAIAIRQFEMKNIIIIPMATHISINPINFFIINTAISRYYYIICRNVLLFTFKNFCSTLLHEYVPCVIT